ncbi:MAG: hypothetical protein IT443_11995 [Phycisphaeraceae bacterium]|nr:hypothetical protein [Phycisphaeraceae bacterium]
MFTVADLGKVANVLSERHGITLVTKGVECQTDGKVITIPALPPQVENPMLLATIRSYVDHECGHIVGESDFALLRKIDEKFGVIGASIFNGLEDIRIESYMTKRWPGCGLNLTAGRKFGYEKIVSRYNGRDNETRMPVYIQVAVGAFVMAMDGDGTPFEIVLGKVARRILGKFGPKILACRTAPSSAYPAELAEEIMEEFLTEQRVAMEKVAEPIRKQDEKKRDLRSQARQRLKLELEKGLADKKSDTGTPAESPSDVSAEDYERSLDGFDEKTQEIEREHRRAVDHRIQDAMTEAREAFSVDPAGRTNEAGQLMAFDFSSEGLGAAVRSAIEAEALFSGCWSVSDGETVKTAKEWLAYLGDGARLLVEHSEAKGQSLTAWMDEARRRSAPAGQVLAQLLRSQAKFAWRSGYRRGRPDAKLLAGMALGVNPRAMRRRYVSDSPKTACYIMGDFSHSVGMTMMNLQAQAIAVFLETIESAGYESKAMFFVQGSADPYGMYSGNQGTLFFMVKNWGEAVRIGIGNLKKVAEYKPTGGSTPLPEALALCLREISARPEPRKVILCLTDGGSDYLRSQNACQAIEKAGVELLMIGLAENVGHLEYMASNLKEIAGEKWIVAMAPEMGRAMAKKIREVFLPALH